MLKKILDSIKKTDPDELIPLGEEYALLVKNKRIIDYSHEQEKYAFDTRVGMYQDTYRYLTAGFCKVTQKINLERFLSMTSEAYQMMLRKSFQVESTQEFLDSLGSVGYQRVQQLYEINGIQLPEPENSSVFCINLMLRPEAKSYLAIGKKPKGKMTPAERIKTLKTRVSNNQGFKQLESG